MRNNGVPPSSNRRIHPQHDQIGEPKTDAGRMVSSVRDQWSDRSLVKDPVPNPAYAELRDRERESDAALKVKSFSLFLSEKLVFSNCGRLRTSTSVLENLMVSEAPCP